MKLGRISLFWTRFTPTESRVLSAIREVLPLQAQSIFDTQLAAINLVRRQLEWNEILFYHRVNGKVDWSKIKMFPQIGEFELADVRFSIGINNYKATLRCISGHIFSLTFIPGEKPIAFKDWNTKTTVNLLSDLQSDDIKEASKFFPDGWSEFLEESTHSMECNWIFFDSHSSSKITIGDSEYYIIAENLGDTFVLCKFNPTGNEVYVMKHDSIPLKYNGSFEEIFRNS